LAKTKTKRRADAAEIRVRSAVSVIDRRRVYAFAYRVLVDEMGTATPHAHADLRRLEDPLDEVARQLYLTRGSTIEGCLRLMIGAGFALPDWLAEAYAFDIFSIFPQEALAFIDRLLVAREARTEGIEKLLLGTAYGTARTEGVRFAFTHSKPSQVDDYRRLGYRPLGAGFEHPELGFQLAHCLVLGDLKHLRSVGSPLATVAGGFPVDDEAVLWFAERISKAA
jgi:GNAT superfamily N-acetyltransferase